MKNTLATLLFAVLIAGLAAPPTFACSTTSCGTACTEYLLNTDFSQGCGWTYYGLVGQASGSEMCNVYSTYAKFGYNGVANPELYQSVTIPSTTNDSRWLVGYNIEVNDPHLSTSNYIGVWVYDQTASTYLYSGPLFYGTDDPSCKFYYGNWSGSLAGHTLIVGASGRVNYSDTHFYITNLVLDSQP